MAEPQHQGLQLGSAWTSKVPNMLTQYPKTQNISPYIYNIYIYRCMYIHIYICRGSVRSSILGLSGVQLRMMLAMELRMMLAQDDAGHGAQDDAGHGTPKS